MGCCQSSLSPVERLTFEYILANIPLHCQQEIIRLPPRKFLNIYQKHLDAEEHLQREEYLAAITSASQAIEELKILLHHHKDHFIFADIHKLLSICYWKMGNIERAFLDGLIALALRIAHMPTDYTQISLQLYRLALIYLVVDKWKEAEDFLIQAITIGRLSTELSQTYIQELEASLAYLRAKIDARSRQKPIIHHFTSIENPEQFEQDTLTDMISIYIEIGLLNIDTTEYQRLPDKQTESQVTDEILNEVLQSLTKYLQEDTFLCKFGAKGGSSSFIAAYFKATQMKTSSLSPAIIEAALTIIINRINDEHFTAVKQSPFMITYTDDDESRTQGVRVFHIKAKSSSEVL